MSAITDEIKARVDLVELVGRSVRLKRSGATSFKGLCPFHQEKTPSFYVFADRHTWVCFGCGKKGSAFDWLMEREHLEFGEALRTLAQMTGVPLPSRRDDGEEAAYRRLVDLMSSAQAFYHAQLQGVGGLAAREYLARRGVSTEAIESFGIGHAGAGSALTRYLAEQGFSSDEQIAAGVVSQGDDGHLFDLLRQRVVFPIRDAQGRVVAFGGRAMDDAQPKYLNTRETLLFHKQETLYALDLARRSIGQERRAVVVEGYMDALTAHQHGFRNVVATLGTALTERHLLALRRLTEEVVLALDSDAAGQAATWRALQLAERSLVDGRTPSVGPRAGRAHLVPRRTVRLKVLTIPGAKDPDELIRSDPGAWRELVAHAQPVVDFVLASLPRRHDLTSPSGKAEAAAELTELLTGVGNPVEQDAYVQRAAVVLGVSAQALRQELRRHRVAPRSTPAEAPARPATAPEGGEGEAAPPQVDALPESEPDRLDAYALALLALVASRTALGDPAIVPAPDEWASPESRALADLIVRGELAASEQGLASPADPALRLIVDAVNGCLSDTARLTDAAVREEMRVVQLRLRQRALLWRQAYVRDILREGSEEERGAVEGILVDLARELNGVDVELSRREHLVTP